MIHKRHLDEVPIEYLSPEVPLEIMTRFLEANSTINIWKWMLLVQDEVFYSAEEKFLESISFFKNADKVLDISWGKGFPVVSRKEKFQKHELTEIGISYDYMFSNSSKANLILSDIKSAISSNEEGSFKWIRVYLLAQVMRQHGVFLEGLKSLLSNEGSVLIFDTRDELMDFSPGGVHLKEMYERLREYQLTQGGTRDAAERIKKRASDLGYRLLDSENIRCPTLTQSDKIQFFRMICLHIETVMRWFPNKFNRMKLFEEAYFWYQDPKCWGSLGLQCVAIQKRSRLGRRRLKSTTE